MREADATGVAVLGGWQRRREVDGDGGWRWWMMESSEQTFRSLLGGGGPALWNGARTSHDTRAGIVAVG